jgi:hypothetical protein
MPPTTTTRSQLCGAVGGRLESVLLTLLSLAAAAARLTEGAAFFVTPE